MRIRTSLLSVKFDASLLALFAGEKDVLVIRASSLQLVFFSETGQATMHRRDIILHAV